MDPETLERKLFEHVDVMSSGGDGGLPVLFWDTQMVSPLAMLLNTATMEFFSSTFFSLFPERLDAARAFGSLAFFMRTKACRDRVMYLCRSAIRARLSLFLQSACFLLSPHTGNSIFSNTTSQHLHGSLRYESKLFGVTDEDVTLLFESLGGVVLPAAKVRRIRDTSPRWRSFGVVVASRSRMRAIVFQWRRARAADVRQKDFSYRGRWKGVSGSVPEAL